VGNSGVALLSVGAGGVCSGHGPASRVLFRGVSMWTRSTHIEPTTVCMWLTSRFAVPGFLWGTQFTKLDEVDQLLCFLACTVHRRMRAPRSVNLLHQFA
jgi:hypothetical protein